jgi:predicted transposase YdaD
MTKRADIGSKRLISLSPDPWVKWVTNDPTVQALDIIDSEFQWISRESDVLMRATSPAHGDFLVLNELQSRYPPVVMPRRLRAYIALAEEKFALPVSAVLINILPPSPGVTVATCYSSTFMGLYAHQDYRVINLWELEAEMVFQRSLVALMPYVPVMRGGDDEPVMRRALHSLRADETLRDLEPLLGFFAGLVADPAHIAQFMRLNMVAIEETPLYKEILQTGLERGLVQGRQEERQQMLQRIITLRFGSVPDDIPPRLTLRTDDELEALLEVVLNAESLDALRRHLDRTYSNQ